MNASTNDNLQLRVLRRQFLFRIVDLEVLSSSALGDSTRLLGRFAALLVFVSMSLYLGLLGLNGADLTPAARLTLSLYTEHLLIATSMLAVGLFAVLSWDSILPNRRDVLVLLPLPVRPKTILLAKLAAASTALALVVIVLNCATGLSWPIAFAMLTPGSQSVIGVARWLGTYWFTVFAASIFIYCGVLALQGLAAQVLPRSLFLRSSGVLQMGTFCLFVSAYFLEPALEGPQMLASPEKHRVLFEVPTYWFLELFDQLNGSMHPLLVPLAQRAWIGLAVSVAAAGGVYAISHLRSMRQIVEESDLSPRRGSLPLPRFGNQLQTAIGQFTARTLARSCQHRLIWAFYLGLGLACTISLLQALRQMHGKIASELWHQPNAPILASSILMVVLAVVGLRVVFAFPLEPRANWIFRIAGIHNRPSLSAAVRRALLLLAVAPVWVTTAFTCLLLWPWRPAMIHSAILGLTGVILIDISVYGFRKIPFTCSYLPGKSAIHMIFLAAVGLMWLVAESAELERRALQEPVRTIAMVTLLSVTAVGLRWGISMRAQAEISDLQFEEEEAPAVLELGLFRDGAVTGRPEGGDSRH
jgi:hypothetical protein